MFHWLLCENSITARWLRTVTQGIAAVFVVALPEVRYVLSEVLSVLNLPDWMIVSVVPILMLLLSPLMAKLGEWSAKADPEQCIVCDAQGNELFIEEALQDCPELKGGEAHG
jgi:hypothetical protein